MGMFKAIKKIKKYDVNNPNCPNGASFFTYSIFWIRAEINNFLWKGDSLIRFTFLRGSLESSSSMFLIFFIIFDIEKVNFKMKVEEEGDE